MYSGDNCIAKTDKCYSVRTAGEVRPSVENWNERIIFPFEEIDRSKPFAAVLYYGKDNYIGELLLPFSEVYQIGESSYTVTVRLVSLLDF